MKLIEVPAAVFRLLNSKQKKGVIHLQAFILIAAVLELVGIAGVAPFMAIAANPGLLETNPTLAALYELSHFGSRTDFLIMAGVFVLVSIALGAVFSSYVTWRTSIYASSVGFEFADRIYAYYLSKNWSYFFGKNSSELTSSISIEALRVTNLVIQPLLLMNSRLALLAVILSGMLIYDPQVTFAAIVFFVAVYGAIYKVFGRSQKENGRVILEKNAARQKLMSESFQGMKTLTVLGLREEFVAKFREQGKLVAEAHGKSFAFAHAPRYLIELIVFGSLISILIYFVAAGNDLGSYLPILSIYAFAGLKLLPALQQTFSCVSIIKSGSPSLEALVVELAQVNQTSLSAALVEKECSCFSPLKAVHLDKITFAYSDEKRSYSLSADVRFENGDFIGIVGPSGSGKSTFLDIVLGLLEPNCGSVFINGTRLSPENAAAWHKQVGYVPQSVFLVQGSIAENVALGRLSRDIDQPRVIDSLHRAGLSDFATDRQRVFNDDIGEQGAKVSGGQRQRIGIARALYEDRQLLVFDEVTSALDTESETLVMNTINSLKGIVTILMVTHNKANLDQCDVVYGIANGAVELSADSHARKNGSALPASVHSS